jgi:serine/threonine protein kinase
VTNGLSIPGFAILKQPPAIGRTACVYKAVSLDNGATVAIKVLTASVEPTSFLDEAFKRETLALAELKHANIVRMVTSGISDSGEKYIVLEWMASDLLQWKARSGNFSWPSFWESVGRPLTTATAFAHPWTAASLLRISKFDRARDIRRRLDRQSPKSPT